MRGDQAIATILQAEGVEQLFCFPSTPVLDACAELGIRPIVARQERVAGNMADGYSRVKNGRSIGVVTIQQNAGAENCFAGLAQAYTDSSPVLFLPGCWSIHTATLPPNFSAATSFERQTRWSDLLATPEGLVPRLRRAFTILRSGRPGPVLLEVPRDVASAEVPDFDYTPPRSARSQGDPQDIVDAVTRLVEAKRPMIWAGQGVLYAEAGAELTEVAELLAAPVATTWMGKSAIDERHPLSIGTAGYSRTAMVSDALEGSDAVFAVGASLARDFTSPAIPGGKTFVHASVDPTDFNTYYAADVTIAGDARLVLRQVIEELKTRRDRKSDDQRAAVEARIADQRVAWKQRWATRLNATETPINPYRVIGEFMRAFDPARTIVTHDSGGSRDQLVPLYEAVNPRGYLGWGHSTQLGFSLGAIMGAKLAAPEKLCAHLLGDAAIGMVGMDLETAVREQIPILTIVLNNGRMGNYERLIPRTAELFDMLKLGGRYADLAQALGVHAERVEQPEKLASAFQRAERATQEGRPALVECMTCVEAEIPYQG